MKLRPKSEKSSSCRSPIVDVVLVIGGAKAIAVKHHSQRPQTVVAALDNAKEIAKQSALHQELGVISISIGEGHTTFSLFDGASPAKQRAIRRTANTAVHTGMGANAVVAVQAATLFVESPEAKALAESLVEQVLELTGGSAELIRLRGLSSYVGGVGAGMSCRFLEYIASEFRKLGIPVAIELDSLGAIAFTRLSKTCRLNAGSVLPALVDFVTDNSNPDFDLVTRRLELSELPPTGQRDELRNLLVVLEEQGITSEQFREVRERVIPNAGTCDRLGNIYLRDTDFVAWLDAAEQVRPAVAAALHPIVHQSLEASEEDFAAFCQEVWEDDGAELPRGSLESIVSRSTSYTFAAFQAAVCQPAIDHQFRLSYTLQDGSRFDAHHVDQLCCTPPPTLGEAFARLHLLVSTVRTGLEVIDDCQAALALVEADQAAVRRRLESAFRLVRRGGGWFVSRRRAMQLLVDYSKLLRSLSDERLEWQAKLREVQLVTRTADREEQKLRQQLSSIDRTLAKFLPQADQMAATTFVRVCDPNSAFPALLSLVGKSGKRQSEILCSLAEAITLEGLAVMLGTTFVDIEEIAQRIVFGQAAYSSPPVGGVRRKSEATTIYALPPVDEPYAAILVRAVTELRPQAIVVFGDTMACGAAVLRVHYRNVHELSEIFVGLLKHNTIAAHSRHDRELHSLGGKEALRKLGMSINGDLRFSPEIPDRFPAELQADSNSESKGAAR